MSSAPVGRTWARSGWPSPEDLLVARHLIESTLPPTPLIRLWSQSDPPIYLKLETTQPTGSFKVRGALTATSAYSAPCAPIVTASAGNHGLGIAWAAARLGVEATVVVAETASPRKIDALRAFPINLVVAGKNYNDAEAHALQLASLGARFVSAYADPYVIAGQSSLLTEVLSQLDGPFTIAAPVGGGGLLAGLALTAYASQREVRVVGVESAASRAVSTAVRTGHVIPVVVNDTIADGLAGNIDPTSITPDIIRFTNTALTAVDDDAIRWAIRSLALDAGLYVEGSAAAGLAAVQAGSIPTDQPIVIAITGRNISTDTFTSAVTAATS